MVRTKVHELSWEGRWTRSATGWGLRYRMDAVEHARPLDARSRLPQGGRVPCGRGAGVRCPCRGMRPSPPPATAVQTGSRPPPGTLLLQSQEPSVTSAGGCGACGGCSS